MAKEKKTSSTKEHSSTSKPQDETLLEETTKVWITCPTCKRKIIETITLCPFCGENINLEAFVEAALIKTKRKNYAVLGFVLSLLSFGFLLFFPLGSLTTAIVGLILAVLSMKEAKVVGTIGVITSLISIATTITLSILVFNFNYTSSIFSWSLRNQDPPMENPSGNAQYKKEAYASWHQLGGEMLFRLNGEGTYEWFKEKNQINQSYSKGVFTLESGITLSDDFLYEDEFYLYYELMLIELNGTKDSPLSFSSTNVKQKVYYFGIDKKNRTQICLEDSEEGTKFCFKKQEASLPTS